MQTNFLDAFNSFNDSFSGSPKQQTPQDQWLKALDFWWQSNKGEVPSDQRDLYSQLVNQGKSMYFIADQFSKIMEATSSVEQESDDWMGAVNKQIDLMKESFNTDNEMNMEGFQDVMGNFSTPNDAWSNFTNSIPGFAQGLGANEKGMALDENQLEQMFEKFLNMPGVGYNREIQEKIQKNTLLFKNYQKVNDEYNKAMSTVGVEALEKLKIRLANLSKQDEKLDSLRQIYNLWVDCNEEAYAEYVFSEEYSLLNGRLVNSLMEYKGHHTELMDELFSDMNIPSKKELEGLLVSQQGFRRKLKKAEEEKASNQRRLDSLEKELQALRAEMKLNKSSASKISVSKSASPTQSKNKKASSAKKKKVTKTAAKPKSVSKKKATPKKAKSAKKIDKGVIEIKF